MAKSSRALRQLAQNAYRSLSPQKPMGFRSGRKRRKGKKKNKKKKGGKKEKKKSYMKGQLHVLNLLIKELEVIKEKMKEETS